MASAALISHSDLFDLIKIIRSHPDISRHELEKTHLNSLRMSGVSIQPEDRRTAVDLAARVMTMVNCQSQNLSIGLVEFGSAYHGWIDHASFEEFVQTGFPTPMIQMTIDKPGVGTDQKGMVEAGLTASRIVKRAKLRFELTNDLRQHLELDRQKRVVRIFHQVAFVKESLRLTKGMDNATIADQMRTGAIPRQIALEILDSIQKVLFRHSDQKSRAVLRSLVSNHNFDPESLCFESSALRLPVEDDIEFKYFGSRMSELLEEIENPAPDGLLEKWLERKSGARYLMLATLIGVLFAVLLGILALAVAIIQTYISYQAWKHPA